MRDKLIHIAFSEEEKSQIKRVSEDTNMTISEFIRQAIFDKIDKIENPEVFNGELTDTMKTKLERIESQISKLMDLQMNHKTAINGNMKLLAQRLDSQEYELQKTHILDILEYNGPLTLEEIKKFTELPEDEILKYLALLQEDNKIDLDTKGRFFINE